MCKIGDLIVITKYKHAGEDISKHTFVVIDDEHGEICGLDYDFVCNVLSSFKDEKHKAEKLRYEGNVGFLNSQTHTDPNNGKDGYIKVNQLYYFNKDSIEFVRIGEFDKNFFERLLRYIENADLDFEAVIDNLQ